MGEELEECPECDGTLVIVEHPDCGPDTEERPCDKCLTVGATEEIRAVARECFGFDKGRTWLRASAWWDHDREGETRIVPAHLPMGRALLCEVLARRVDRSKRWGHEAWEFQAFASDGDWSEWGHCLDAPGLGALIEEGMPEDAPPDLRLARALCLAVEVTLPDDAAMARAEEARAKADEASKRYRKSMDPKKKRGTDG